MPALGSVRRGVLRALLGREIDDVRLLRQEAPLRGGASLPCMLVQLRLRHDPCG